MRGVDATVKFATAAPDGVNRSSGSAVRFPMTVMMVSPATMSSWVRRASAVGGREHAVAESLRNDHDASRSFAHRLQLCLNARLLLIALRALHRRRVLVLVGAHHLGA